MMDGGQMEIPGWCYLVIGGAVVYWWMTRQQHRMVAGGGGGQRVPPPGLAPALQPTPPFYVGERYVPGGDAGLTSWPLAPRKVEPS
jgi:hypothetical protein